MGVDTIGEVGGLSDNCPRSARKFFTLLTVNLKNQQFAAMIPLFWCIFVFGYDDHNVLSIDDKQNSHTCIIIAQKVGG